MLRRIFFFALVGIVSLRGGIELALKDLDFKSFNAAGRCVRWLKAEAGGGSTAVPILKNGVVEFFGGGAATEKLGTLSFAEASYDRAADTIESQGPMQFNFPDGNISAVGFKYALATGKLTLNSHVEVQLPTIHIDGDRGEATIAENAVGSTPLVTMATIRDHVTATGPALRRFKADRAETTAAVYTAVDEMLKITSPVPLWFEGVRVGEAAGVLEFKIGPLTKSAPSSATPIER